jgi:hypothetical protein
VAVPEQIGENAMIENITWFVDIVVDIVRGALGMPPARRQAKTYAPAYAMIRRRTSAC